MLLSEDKSFKLAVELAIVNYSEIDIFYKCGYFNNLKLPAKAVVEVFKHKLSKYLPFKMYYQIQSIGNFTNISKLAIFIPSKYIRNMNMGLLNKEERYENTIIDLIDNLWLESINTQKAEASVSPKLFISKDFILKSRVDDYEQVVNSFDVFLPTEQDFLNSIDAISTLLLKAVSEYNNERIDFLKYEFKIPEGIDNEIFLANFNKLLSDSFECKHLIVPDIKLRGSSIYDLFILFPLYKDFNVNINTIQSLIRTMWYRTLIRHGKGNIETMFALVLNFSKYNINEGLKSSNFSMGLYRLNRKVSDIYKASIKY